MSLVTELRRRQVFRAAAWYSAAAWVAIQVASTVIPQFELPEWLVRAVIVAALLGLPIALGFAWSFDLGALGLRREVPAPSTDGESPAAAAAPAAPLWRIPSFWIAIALGVGVTLSAQQAWQRIVRPAVGERVGLAVLPFANLSPDPANAYFADGLHEEILATFARASGLRVISRTSVQQYRDPQRNLREIAEALDANLILEGSVRREGDDLRLTLQLIDGHTDEHLWAETYDRKFRDALQLQRTVAEEVVARIGATLTPTEQRLIAEAATSNPEAYDRYLQALALYGLGRSVADLRLIEQRLGEAIELEPAFALAYALRASVRVELYGYDGEDSIAKAARSDIDRAFELQPDLPEAFVARGVYYTYVTVDPERGLVDLERALAVAPNDAQTQLRAGMTLRRLGRVDEALKHFDHAARLSSGEEGHALMAAWTRAALGRHEEADRAIAKLIQRHPASVYARMARRENHFLATGETAGWREEYDRLTTQTDPRFPEPFPEPILAHVLLTCTGDLPNLIPLYERLLDADGWEGWTFEDPELLLGLAHTAAGSPERARSHLEGVATLLEKHRDHGVALSQLAVALQLLGRTDEAVRAADEAKRLYPEARDALNGPHLALRRAWVLIHSAERAEEGYAELERLVGAFNLNPRWVAAQLMWVILRDDARAQRIIRGKFPDA